MSYSGIITMEPGKRGGKPCIRGLRVTVYDVQEYLASGMSRADILREFPYSRKKIFGHVSPTPLIVSANPTFQTREAGSIALCKWDRYTIQ